MTLGSWRVWEVFAIYQRVPRGSSQKLGIGSPVWGLGSLGGLGRLVDQPGGCQGGVWHISISASQHGIS